MKRLLSFIVGLSFCAAAAAQYPQKPIRMVVPFPPGGAADLTARVVAQPLGQVLGQPVVLDYKAGADGAIAGNDVKNASPDGYTLLFGTNTGMCAAPVLRKNPPYDPLNDFTPVALVGKFGFFVFAHASVPAKDMKGLIEYVKQNPGKLNYGTGNSTSIITTAQLASMEGLKMQHIPYKGDAAATLDLVAGRVQFLIATPGSVIPHVKDGKVRAHAALLPSRSPLLPDAPTMKEAGLKDIPIQPYAAIYGPARMPKDVVDRLEKAVQQVMAMPAVKEGVARHAFEAQSSTTEELVAFHREQLELWRKTTKEVGIVPD
ncbi:MAG TPA: tripartite tricarboxylate transporter substrate binding protein [Burkholderiales bacterium]|nr:tripartite tricarboxylate transporter substrate binding protein [Burkholderiales bacterium]